jgi:hypothetical protein
MSRTAVAIVALVAGLGLGVWFFSKDAGPANTNGAQATANSTTQEVTTYRDATTGFEVQYPSAWKKSEDVSGEGANAIRNITFTGSGEAVTITVVNTSFEGIIRESLSIEKETDVTLANIPAKRLDAGSERDGSPQTVVLVKRGTTLISLNGQGQAFEQMLTSFRWPE